MELTMEREKRESHQREQQLQQEKANEAAAMGMKLKKLKTLQEQALGVVDTKVEKEAVSPDAKRAAPSRSSSAGKSRSPSSPTTPARARQMLYWEVMRSKMEQSAAPVKRALVTEAIEKEKERLQKLGSALEREQAELADKARTDRQISK